MEIYQVPRGNNPGGMRETDICPTITTSAFEQNIRLIEAVKLNRYKNETSDRVYSEEGLCPALTTMTGGGHEKKVMITGQRIRKLTPRECWRLMGFTDTDFDKAKAAGVSDSQLYKQAGNSIVVNVLEAIFREMIE